MLPDFEFSCSMFKKYGLELSELQYEKMDKYAEFLAEYNKNVNLTAITESKDILIKHFIDSILLTKYIDFPQGASLIDVGTGAGFPSVPLKIMRDDLKITLLDSLAKRITFLEKLCDIIGADAEFVHGRAEDISKMPEYREKFDFSCARAVANLSVLSELCIPFVKVGGHFLSLKGPNEEIDPALKAFNLLGGNVENSFDYDLESDQRRLIVIKKISQTPTKYPRNSSQIKKKPL